MMWAPNAVSGENGCPSVLFHGTSRERLTSIRRDGLIPHEPASGPGPEAVYLTSSLHQAVTNSGGIDWETETFDLDCLLVVEVTGVPLCQLAFYTCMQPIPPGRITGIATHPALRSELREETGW